MEDERPRSTSDWNDMSFSDPAPRILQTEESLALLGSIDDGDRLNYLLRVIPARHLLPTIFPLDFGTDTSSPTTTNSTFFKPWPWAISRARPKWRLSPVSRSPSSAQAQRETYRDIQLVMIRMVPLSLGTALIAPKTCLALGLANTSPAALALNRPEPTNPTVPGS